MRKRKRKSNRKEGTEKKKEINLRFFFFFEGGIELLKLDYVDTSDVHDRFFAEVSKFRYTFGQIMEKYRNELMVMKKKERKDRR